MSNQKTYEWPAFDLKVKQYEIWAVEWKNNPRNIRLVLIVQGNHLNDTDQLKKLRRNLAIVLGFMI
ncbi:hypothetical protein [Sediminibacterium sp. TEGAF015]|uniref:hypothetical protein n=1 Tax=Sediminibacterium sp. TEGAF015 TaxID=575378 RepID=UPI0021F9A884|nr:hypothetical protein [Sediminibacterium sp. TEGAF015]BDQ13306.1 hypothetical protein TEGAF0_25230 [Sediminibacterium sp. TEGAF015]